MDPAAPATRMTSSFTINISTPSFYNPPKKFAPVVPPKPKVNPFKASEEPESQSISVAPQERSSGPGVRAFLGKVGEIPSSSPSSGDQEDFILPPPPPNDDAITSPTIFFPPPPPSFGDDNLGSPTSTFPPPPPLDFSEPFPPAVEETFPSPPPLEESLVEAIEGTDIQVNSVVVPPPPPAPITFSPKPAAPTFVPKPAAPTFVPKPAIHTFVPKPPAPAFTPEAPAPTFSPKPAAPTFSPKPAAPTFSPKPAAPTFSPKPTAPTFSPKPAAPTFVPKPAAPTFVPKPATPAFVPEPPAPAFVTDPAISLPVRNPSPPLAVAPKPAAPFAVSSKPSKFVPKQPDPYTLSSPPSAPAPPPSHTFSPKPLNPPTFSPKPSAPTFVPKPSVSSSFSPKPQDANKETSQPQQKFSTAQPSIKQDPEVTCEPPRPSVPSGTRAPGFTFAQQREKPQVLEKPRPDAEGPQSQNIRSLGSHNESIRSQANGAHRFRSQPEVLLDARPKPDEIQKKEPPPKMQRPPEADGSAGPPGLNMNEVMELEMLTQQLMREMDNQQATKSHTMDRCGFCGQGLSRTETIVKAGEHHYHVACFTCSKCDQQLQGRQYYESGGKPLCEECYEDTLERCAVCDKKITERLLKAMEKCYHPGCFTCAVCRCSLQGVPFIVDDNNQPHCVTDYHRKYAPRCSVCGEPIAPEPGRDETVRVFALERNFHMMCYRCEDCSCPLSVEANDSGCFPLDNHVLCKKCYTVRARAAL